MDKYAHLYASMEAARKLKEGTVYTAWKSFINARASYLVFLENSCEASTTMYKLNQEDFSILNPLRVGDDVRWRKQRRLVRQLYNTISAGQNFNDHLQNTHRFSEQIFEPNFSIFFRELRHYLVHNNTFQLTGRIDWIQGEVNKYQGMDKTKFEERIRSRLLSCDEPKEKAKLQLLMEMLDDMQQVINFEPFFRHYQAGMIRYYRRWVSFMFNKIKIGMLTDFLSQAEALVDTNHPVLNKTALRFLRIALDKKQNALLQFPKTKKPRS